MINQPAQKGSIWLLCYGAKVCLLFALYDLARVFMVSPPNPPSPFQVASLLASGFISYIFLGVLLGAIIAIMWEASGWIQRIDRTRLVPVVFWWAAAFAILFGLAAGVFVNIFVLAFVGLFHPLSILVSLIIIAFSGLVVTPLFYMILARMHRSTRRPAAKMNNRPVRVVVLALPVLLILVSFFLPARELRTTCEVSEVPDTKDNGTLASTSESLNDEKAKYNILLVSVECIRADHLNTYGYVARETSPFIDVFSRDSALFLHNYAQAPWTRPSMASLFTSLYPAQHGATNLWDQISNGLPSLPRTLAAAGYRTVTFFTNPIAVDPRLGFEEVYAYSYPRIARSERLVPFSFRPFLCRHFLSPIFTIKLKFLTVADIINGSAYVDGMRMNLCLKEWFYRSCTEPFFVHVHYNDPHDPYFERPLKSFQLNVEARWNVNTLVERYDGEIRFFDQVFRDLYALIEDRGLLDRTIVVLVADHGEEFLDHGQWRHTKTLFEELIHVPLIMRFPDGLGKGMRIETQVRSIDIAPTLLEAVGIPVPGEMEGESLLPIIRGEDDRDRPAVSQTETALYSLDCIVRPPFKYIERTGAGGDVKSLYDLKRDPKEKENLAAERNQVMESLSKELHAFPIAVDVHQEDQEEGIQPMDDLMKERLKALGYIN